jgi:hypothetical protein
MLSGTIGAVNRPARSLEQADRPMARHPHVIDVEMQLLIKLFLELIGLRHVLRRQ